MTETSTETPAVQNSQVPAKKEKAIGEMNAKELFETDKVKSKFQEMLGKRATSFITSVLQIVASNKLLAKADPMSIYQSAAVAATLDLPLNNNLGFAYIIPYGSKGTDDQGNDKTIYVAQFQMGYKGFIQLAQRSGQVRKLYATEIYEGQVVSSNPLTGYEFDFTKKTSETIVGYAARIELLNGFECVYYMTMDELKKHGLKFSQTFRKNYGLWVDDFHSMAKKTVTKLLISKYSPLSVDMQRAVIVDQAVINNAETQDVTYVDHIEIPKIDQVAQRLELLIENAETPAILEGYLEHCVTDEHKAAYKAKLNQLLDADLNQDAENSQEVLASVSDVKSKKAKAA